MAMNHTLERITIVYFSGTGGTRRAAEGFAEAFTGQGIPVETYELNKHHPEMVQKRQSASRPEKGRLLLLLFPVHAFNAPKPLYEYIDSLAAVKEAEAENAVAAVVSVSGGGEMIPNNASRLHSIRRLERKGYRVVYEAMLALPCNFAATITDSLSVRLLEILPVKIRQIASDLLSERVRRTRPGLADKMMSVLGEAEKSKFASRWFSKQIQAGRACNGCGVCAEHCPQMNITMISQLPVFKTECVICLRCLYGCPSRALTLRHGRFILLPGGYDLNAIESSLTGAGLPSVESMKIGWAFNGIKEYLKDTAITAKED